jgi:hypothetical protein
MRLTHFHILSAVALASGTVANAQGTFQNLNFESATLSPVPVDGPVVYVPISAGLPGWTGYLGTVQQTQIIQNNYALSLAGIDILGPNYPAASSLSSSFLYPGVIDGNYSVLLQAGADSPENGLTEGASIAQTGIVPLGSQSLQFRAWTTAPYAVFTVSFNGTDLSPVALGTGVNYTLYGVNISPYDGQTGPLEFTADSVNPGSSWLGLDDIAFSPQVIPEPSPLVLTGVGALVFALYRRLAPKRK